jgi:hypothetical protein
MTLRRMTGAFLCDRRGQALVEYVLLLAAVVLPATYLFMRLLATLRNMYAFVSLVTSLPFP